MNKKEILIDSFAKSYYNNFCCENYSHSKNVRLAQLDRAFGYGPKGRGFESSNARKKRKFF